jgi:DNA-binding MarR family transcriptional regulator
LCLHTQRAGRALARRFDDALRPTDLTNGQFSLLISLNRLEPPTIGNVSALMAMDRTTLTANLKPLERRGLVKVAVAPADKRSRLLTLTPAGHALIIGPHRYGGERTRRRNACLVPTPAPSAPPSARFPRVDVGSRAARMYPRRSTNLPL